MYLHLDLHLPAIPRSSLARWLFFQLLWERAQTCTHLMPSQLLPSPFPVQTKDSWDQQMWNGTELGVMLFACIPFGDTEVGLTIFLTGASHRQVSTLITPGFRIQIPCREIEDNLVLFSKSMNIAPSVNNHWIFSIEVYYTQCYFIDILLIVFVNILN